MEIPIFEPPPSKRSTTQCCGMRYNTTQLCDTMQHNAVRWKCLVAKGWLGWAVELGVGSPPNSFILWKVLPHPVLRLTAAENRSGCRLWGFLDCYEKVNRHQTQSIKIWTKNHLGLCESGSGNLASVELPLHQKARAFPASYKRWSTEGNQLTTTVLHHCISLERYVNGI